MNIKEAVQLADQYFSKINKGKTSYALDAETHWLFYGGEPDVVEVGGSGIKMEKSTGIIEDFILPDPENFLLLEHAQEIEIERTQ